MTTTTGERLPYLLGKLKAPRVLERLEQTAERARAEKWPYEQFLETLLEAEVYARDASGARMRVRHAAFPARKTLDDFDWTAPAHSGAAAGHTPRSTGLDLRSRKRVLPGTTRNRQDPPGDRAFDPRLPPRLSGRVRHRPRMGQPTRARAQDQNRLEHELRRLERYHLIICDEIGYLPLERQAANLLFALVSRRYERGSIIITSNRGFEQWGEILGDAMVAAALIDRLVHHATMITLKGKSYRLRQRAATPPPARTAG